MDPEPDPQDPQVFGPPGSGSISQSVVYTRPGAAQVSAVQTCPGAAQPPVQKRPDQHWFLFSRHVITSRCSLGPCSVETFRSSMGSCCPNPSRCRSGPCGVDMSRSSIGSCCPGTSRCISGRCGVDMSRSSTCSFCPNKSRQVQVHHRTLLYTSKSRYDKFCEDNHTMNLVN